MRPSLRLLVVAFLIGLGIFARLNGLDEHFTNEDDLSPIAAPYRINNGFPLTIRIPVLGREIEVTSSKIKRNPLLYAAAVAYTTTYGPLQYFFYPFILNGEYGYREYLFRGRLPSALAAIMALLAFFLCLRSLSIPLESESLIGLALYGMSLMNIIYAQQGGSYASAGLGSSLILLGLIRCGGRHSSTGQLMVGAIIGAILAHANYQVMAFIPAAFAAFFITELRQGQSSCPVLLKRYSASFAVFVALITPLSWFLIKQMASDITHLSPEGRFSGAYGYIPFFLRTYLAGQDSWILRIPYGLLFLLKSIYVVVKTTTAVSPSHAPGDFFALIWTACFLTGLISMIKRRGSSITAATCFILFVGAEWLFFNITNRWPLSPSRHVLILTPIIILVIVLGLREWRDWLRRPQYAGEALSLSLLVSALALFFSSYQSFRSQRKDPFSEELFRRLLSEHKLTAIVSYDMTQNFLLMFRRSSIDIQHFDITRPLRLESSIVLPPTPFLLASYLKPWQENPAVKNLLESRNLQVDPLLIKPATADQGIFEAIITRDNGIFIYKVLRRS